MILPIDVKIIIYSFLEWKDVKKIETSKDIYLLLIKMENRDRSFYYERIYKNMVLHKCFKCTNNLQKSYVINICAECKYIIKNQFTYPMYCKECIHIRKPRGFERRKCHLCNYHSGFLGIEPYS